MEKKKSSGKKHTKTSVVGCSECYSMVPRKQNVKMLICQVLGKPWGPGKAVFYWNKHCRDCWPESVENINVMGGRRNLAVVVSSPILFKSNGHKDGVRMYLGVPDLQKACSVTPDLYIHMSYLTKCLNPATASTPTPTSVNSRFKHRSTSKAAHCCFLAKALMIVTSSWLNRILLGSKDQENALTAVGKN